MVKIRKRVFNREAAKRFNLKLDNTFTAVDTPISNTIQVKTNEHPQEPTNFYIAALLLGLGLAAMAMGIFISMKIFNIPDITTDGSYTLGAVITGILLSAHIPTPFALIGSILAGAIAGSFTGIIHTRLKVNPLLSGILVMTALYSVNLTVLGRSNLPLLKLNNIFEEGQSLIGHRFGQLGVLLLVIGFIWLAISWLLRTDFGLAMRATGNSESMIRALGVNTNNMKVIGLALANGLTALSGSLIAQYQGFVDINMGIGIVIAGLGAVMIGETIIKSIGLKSIIWNLLGVIIGSILFRLILAFTLAAGLNPNLIKLVTALLVLIAVSAPALRKR
jgi:putative ABC transport system permease protein